MATWDAHSRNLFLVAWLLQDAKSLLGFALAASVVPPIYLLLLLIIIIIITITIIISVVVNHG